MDTLKIAKGYVTELPSRTPYRGKRHIKVIYGARIWEIIQEYFKAHFEVQGLPHVVPCRALGVDKIEYTYVG